jgi:hypothetical protein
MSWRENVWPPRMGEGVAFSGARPNSLFAGFVTAQASVVNCPEPGATSRLR